MQRIGMINNVSFSGNNVFSVFQASKPVNVSKNISSDIPKDTVELSKSKMQNKPKMNKKFVKGAAVAVLAAVAVAATIFAGKNMNKVSSVVSQHENYSQKGIDHAVKSLITDVESKTGPDVNGICFYGPDCKGKEEMLGGFVKRLSDAGYEIKHTPRASQADNETIGNALYDMIEGAKNLFKKENKRTAIVVRDLDKLAPDNSGMERVTSIMKRYTEHAKEKGYVIVSEAQDITNVDSAVRRIGRMEEKILVKPLASDPIQAHKKYGELLAKNLQRA